MKLEEIKDYRELASEEQVKIIVAVSEYIQVTIPKLKASGRFLNEKEIETFRKGIELLYHFVQMRVFCRDAYTAKSNFDQLVNRMAYLFNIVKNELAKEMQVRTSNGEQVIVLQVAQTLRRGRPTAAESEQREREKKEAERAEAIAKLTGARVANVDTAPVVDRESDTSRRKKDEPDLFSQAVEKEVNGDDVSDSGEAQPEELKSLREWAWCLPDPLPDQIKMLRDLRAEMANESEQAKSMMLAGEAESEIAKHSHRAKEINFEIRDIYAKVDDTLACYYIILAKLNKEYGKLAERYEKHGGYDVLVNDLKPYFDKFDEANQGALAAKAEKMNAAYIAATTRDPEKEAKFHRIDAYFRRKDVKASQKRLDKMREYYQQAVELECDADTLAGFQVFIDACEAELKK